MKIKLQLFLWKIFGRPDFPPKGFKIKVAVNRYPGKTQYPNIKQEIVFLYNSGVSVEKIAFYFNVTRERVRQCLWKCFYESI